MRYWQGVIRGLKTAMVIAALSLATVACGTARTTANPVPEAGARALGLTQARTPRFRVSGYDTRGAYVQVEGRGDLRRVNAALRRIVTSDQRPYAKPARQASKQTAPGMRGRYSTDVDAKLVSASTVVVSVLMPALHLFPGGTEGGVFVSGTVLVPSGRRIGLMQLFVDPARALPVLASEFKKAFARQGRERGGCVKWVPKALEPTAHNYRHFALLPTALAIGVTGYGNCMQLVATVPYAELRPHFSDLARILIDAVRRPSGS